MTSPPLTRDRAAELLAHAPADDLVALADECLADGVELTVLAGPEVGTVAAQVREPIAHDRFLLGDVLACRAEVTLGGQRGWAMRLGDNRIATLAAAVCDAELAADRPGSQRVRDLCRRVEHDRAVADRDEWDALAPTVVRFEELT